MSLKELKKAAAVLFITLAVLSAGGCSQSGRQALTGRVPIQDRLIVTAVGIDKQEGGEGYHLTYQIFQGSASSGEAEVKVGNSNATVLNTTGRTMYEAYSELERKTGRHVYQGMCNVIVISSEVAQEDIKKIVSYYATDWMIGLSAKVVCSEGKSADIINVKQKNGIVPADTMLDVINAAEECGMSSPCSLVHVYPAVENIPILLPMVSLLDVNNESQSNEGEESEKSGSDEEENKAFSIDRSVLISSGKMDGVFGPEEIQGANLLTDGIKKLTATYQDKEDIYTEDISVQVDSKKIIFNDNEPCLRISLSVKTVVPERNNSIKSMPATEAEEIRKLIEERCERAWRVFALEKNADVFELEGMIQKYSPEYKGKISEIKLDVLVSER